MEKMSFKNKQIRHHHQQTQLVYCCFHYGNERKGKQKPTKQNRWKPINLNVHGHSPNAKLNKTNRLTTFSFFSLSLILLNFFFSRFTEKQRRSVSCRSMAIGTVPVRCLRLGYIPNYPIDSHRVIAASSPLNPA